MILAESMEETAAFGWLEQLGDFVLPRFLLAPGEPASERDSFSGYVPADLQPIGVILQ
jgi:hypothetical protein